MEQIFCPECGNKISADNTKLFCFCTQCGTKIDLSSKANLEPDVDFTNMNQSDDYLEEKLKEVEFYYKLSFDKKEYADIENQPTYYIKAQDLLVDLSGEYEKDFRIWWNLAKPVDYMCTEFVLDCRNYEINEMYFQKALDAAQIEDKIELVKAHDEYVERKKDYLIQTEEVERLRVENEKAEQEKREQEERERLQREQEMREQAERDAKEQEEREIAEKKQKACDEQKKYENEIKPLNFNLWDNFNSKNYEKIDGAYFSYTDEKSDVVIVVIRNISNMLHLIAYKKSKQNNVLYNMQTITVKIDNKGNITGFDNKPVVLLSSGNAINIHYNSDKVLKVNEFDLISDADYVEQISKIAKKPLIKSKILR